MSRGLGMYGCACREQDVSIGGISDAAVEPIADWTVGIFAQPVGFSLFPSNWARWERMKMTSHRDSQWNSRSTCLDSVSLCISYPAPGQTQSSIYCGQCNACKVRVFLGRRCKEPEAKRRLGTTAWQRLTAHGFNLGCWQAHKGVVT